MSNKNILWPKESQIMKYNSSSSIRGNGTISMIKSLFYNTGILSSVLYLLLITVVQPLLDKQYERRRQLTLSTVIRIRKLVPVLLAKVKDTSTSILGVNETATTVSRFVQTNNSTDDLLSEYNDIVNEDGWNMANMKLKQANYVLRQLSTVMESEPDSMQAFQFEAKLLNNQLALYDDNTNAIKEKTEDITDSIREIKGWFVTGKIA